MTFNRFAFLLKSDQRLPYTSSLALITIVLALLVGVWLKKVWKDEKNQLPLPPQPPGNFILGNLFEILEAVNKKQPHLLFARWAREYGGIVRVRSGPFTQYHVNSDRAVQEILDHNSAFTSHRPRWIYSGEQITGGMNMLFLNADDPRWKYQRKFIHSHFGSIPRADAGLRYLQFESVRFLHQVATSTTYRSNSKLHDSLLRFVYSTLTSQAFGMDIPEIDNPVIHDIHETGLAQIEGLIPGKSLVDTIPILDYLPMLLKPWERRNRQRFARDVRFVQEKMQRLRTLRSNGYMTDAFLPLLDTQGKVSEFDQGIDEAAYLSFMLILGASDTTTTSIWSFIEAMLLYPDVQVKARQKITEVVGDRIPVYADLERIPFVRCLMKETWRWRPVIGLGIPHNTTRELIYNGFRIPRGAQLQLNAYAIQHDPQRHYKPDDFIPERYEGDLTNSVESSNSKDVSQRDHFVFGAGRRMCPGTHVAERFLAVSIMRILWAFQISPSADATLPLNPADFEGLVMPGVPDRKMPVCLTIISESRKQHIEQALQDVSATRMKFEPLADPLSGVGVFEKLPFTTSLLH